MSQRRKKRERRKGGTQWVVPHLLQRDEQGGIIDLMQGVRESAFLQIKSNQVYFDTTFLKKINQGCLLDNY